MGSEQEWVEAGGAARGRPRRVVLFAMTAAGVLGCLGLVSSFVPALTWSVAVAVATHGVYRWVLGRVKRPTVAALLSVLMVFLLVVIPVVLLVYNVGSQLMSLAELVRSGAAQDWVQGMLREYPRVQESLGRVRGMVSLRDGSEAAAGYLGGKLQGVLTGSVRTVTQAGVMLFTLFFLYRDGDKARQEFRSTLPMRGQDADFLLKRMAETISASLQGSMTIAAIQGSLGGVIFWVLSVPQAFLWAFVMGMMALIPSLGTFVVWAPVAVYLLLSGHVVKATILFAFGAGVIASVDNLLYPKLVGGRLKLHTIPMFFSVLGGIGLFGLSGLVLGPLLLTTTLALLHVWNPEVLPIEGERR